MNAISVQPVVDMRKVRRAVRSPKGNLVLVLGAIAVIALTTEDASYAIPTVMNAVGAATLADIIIQRIERGIWIFPTAGILSAAPRRLELRLAAGARPCGHPVRCGP